MANQRWVQGAIKHPGALHRELNIPSDKKIPAKTLNAAAKKGGVLDRQARLAKTMEGFKHTGSHHITAARMN